MDIHIKEDTSSRLVVDIKEGSPAAVLVLKNELWNNEHVKAVGVHAEHPLIRKETLVLETSGQEPRKVITASIKKAQQDLDKALASVKASK